MGNIAINGPKILFTLPFFGGVPITETIVNSWIVVAFIAALCIYLSRNLSVENPSKKQIIAEKLVLMLQNLVDETMGKQWRSFTPYIGGLFSFSLFSSLLSLTGLRSPTADLSTTLAMALVTFVMVHSLKFKTNGFIGYFKGYTEPIIAMTPLNIVGEIANPISMSFRHFGNIVAGVVINAMIYASLGGLSAFILQIIPNTFIQSVPLLQVGLPAVLSLYFDVFTSFMQAYIFCMLTMVFVSSAAE